MTLSSQPIPAPVPAPGHEPVTHTMRRYRSSTYYLYQQLQHSEARQEFQQIKTMVNRLKQFSPTGRLQFAEQTVEP